MEEGDSLLVQSSYHYRILERSSFSGLSAIGRALCNKVGDAYATTDLKMGFP